MKNFIKDMHRKSEQGFSLIELLVAIVVIGIILSLAMQSMNVVIDDNRRITTEREMDKITRAIVGNPDIANNGMRSDFGYVGDNGSFPASLQDLISNTGGWSTWDGPYLDIGISQDTNGYKIDEWGKPYNYSGGITLISSGNGSTISKKIADASSDYLLNRFNGVIKDSRDSIPGSIYKDSIDIKISIPNGSGSMITKTYNPEADGIFALDSLPAGQHHLNIIYSPENDTLSRYLTILPRHKSSAKTFNFASAHFSSGGGSSTSEVEILRPTGIGTYTETSTSGCFSNWECVDDITNDGSASYVYQTSSDYYTDTYELENHSTGTGTIDSLIIFFSSQETSPSGRISTQIRTNGTDHYGIQENPTDAYENYSSTYVNNPSTSSPWTWNEIDNLEIGVNLRRCRCTQVWVEVFYTY